MFGWGTGHAFGVAGAALASFIAIVAGCVAFVLYFMRAKSHMRFRPADWPPNLRLWWHMLRVGLPVGGEFALLSFYLIFVYSLIRPFGAAAQAGFGIGVRVMQSLFLPSVAIGFATAPVTGQNVGARLGPRVRETFYSAAGMSAIVMAVFTILCQIAPGAMIRIFNTDPGVIAVGSGYLRIISWNFVASGIVFVASSVFQGLGNTVPALATSALRLTLFVVSALALSRSAGFHINQLWYVSLVTVFIQAVLSVWLLHREFDRRLPA
jgi:Na+-driven multidrug efflux pump